MRAVDLPDFLLGKESLTLTQCTFLGPRVGDNSAMAKTMTDAPDYNLGAYLVWTQCTQRCVDLYVLSESIFISRTNNQISIFFFFISYIMGTEEVRKQPLTAYNVFILIFIGLGSVSYGYAAAIIGQTLGVWEHFVFKADNARSTNFYRVFSVSHAKQWHRSSIIDEWTLPNRRCDWNSVTAVCLG
jgi:hypothetical protein